MEEMCRLMGVTTLHTTSWHPSGNGRCERMNQSLTRLLSHYIDSDQKNWDQLIDLVLYAYRSAVHTSTGETPHFLLFGRDMPVNLMSFLPSRTERPNNVTEYKSELVQRMSDIF